VNAQPIRVSVELPIDAETLDALSKAMHEADLGAAGPPETYRVFARLALYELAKMQALTVRQVRQDDLPPFDRRLVSCPREHSFMTPCIARDGSLALADDKTCVGCGADPADELASLAKRYPPAGKVWVFTTADEVADALPELVWAYIHEDRSDA
jgi:hypothetical protein